MVKKSKRPEKPAKKGIIIDGRNVGGRPKKWHLTEELANKICSYVAIHPMSLERICMLYADELPPVSIVKEWKRDVDWFSAKYAQAKQKQIQEHVEHTLDLADNLVHRSAVEEVTMQHVIAVKEAIAIRQWHASKLAPKIYGNKPQEDEQKDHNTVINFYPSNQKPKE